MKWRRVEGSGGAQMRSGGVRTMVKIDLNYGREVVVASSKEGICSSLVLVT